jgi:hypothetical protein
MNRKSKVKVFSDEVQASLEDIYDGDTLASLTKHCSRSLPADEFRKWIYDVIDNYKKNLIITNSNKDDF